MSMLQKQSRCPTFVGLLACAGALPPATAQPRQSQPQPEETEPLPRRVAIRFLTDSDYPPFNYYDEDNVLTGFNVDIARSICLELVAACDIQVRAWQELLLPALRRGEADAVIASHAVSANALKAVDFTDRYYHTPARFAAKRTAGRLDVTPEGLEGKRIAVTKGTAHEAYLRAFFRDSSIRAYESPELARDALISGAVELLFDDGIGLAFWLNGTGSKACCEFKGGPFGEPKYFGDGVAVAVSREDQQLKVLINAALRRCARTAASRSWCCAIFRYVHSDPASVWPSDLLQSSSDHAASRQRPAQDLLCPSRLPDGRPLRRARHRHRPCPGARRSGVRRGLARGRRGGGVDDVEERPRPAGQAAQVHPVDQRRHRSVRPRGAARARHPPRQCRRRQRAGGGRAPWR